MSPVARLHIEAVLSGVSAVSLPTPRTDEVLIRKVGPLSLRLLLWIYMGIGWARRDIVASARPMSSLTL
jgi:hypothetical protein